MLIKKPIDETAFYRDVGQLIAIARRRRNLTQEQLADAVGLARTSITNIEKGRQKVLLHTICDVAAVLRVEPIQLFPSESMATSQVQRLESSKRDILLRAIPELSGGFRP
jgi:transcriptional regulator with XRE-family HTH domain